MKRRILIDRRISYALKVLKVKQIVGKDDKFSKI